MNTHKHKTLEDTVYFWFGSNATSGEGNDGATPVFDVRLAGAAAGAAPVLSGAGTLLTHVDFPAGAHEIAVAATAANGFAAGNTYGVFCSLLVDSVNPTGVAGEFTLAPVISNVKQISDDSTAADNLELDYDGTGYAKPNSTIGIASVLTGHTPQTGDSYAPLAAGIDSKVQDATLVASLQNIIDVVESNRIHHTHSAIGNIFYVDPVNGDTFGNGNRGGISDPLLTIQDCHDNLVTDSNHDLIILVSGATGGPTTHTVAATTTLSKRYMFIRGPGRDFIVTRTGAGDTFAITEEGIEISGIQLGTAAVGSGDGIAVTADFAYLHSIWINDTQGNGIFLNQAENCIVEDNRFQDTGAGGAGDGVQISGTGSSSSNNVVRNNIFEDVQGDAVKLVGGTILDTVIQGNTIHGSTGWGINISADSTDAIVTDNRLGNNTSGDIQDLGTTTVKLNNEQWGTDELTADAVWDELLTGSLHNIATSAGRRLRQLSTPVLTEGPSAGSNAATYINLEVATASALDGAYDPGVVFITTGTGMGQSRQIFEYDGTLKRAFINRDWKSIPALNDEYVIVANAGNTHVNEGLAGGGGPSTITLNSLASSVDDTYVDQVVFIVAGTGQDQAGNITAYNGTTKVATVEHAWVTQPVSGSIYAILPCGTHSITEIQSGLSTSTVTDRIAAIQEADKVFVPAAGTLTYNTKGTSTGLLKKNLKDPAGAAVDSTEDIIASEVDTTP